jgi:REP element-mobilizing transposase RayT
MAANTKHYNPDRHHRRSVKLEGHDYRFGTYFITIDTNIVEPVFDIPQLKQILWREWYMLPRKYPGIDLGAFVIMPNHIHFLFTLKGLTSPNPYLWQVIRHYKSKVADNWLFLHKKYHMNCSAVFWQDAYWESIVFNARERAIYERYIRENPEKLSDPKELIWIKEGNYFRES